jgi:hypothetical protein
MVPWSPSREKRRSKKTPHVQQLPCRTPPRPPQGTPQTKKKPKVSASPEANRFHVLADDTMEEIDTAPADVEMEEDNAETLAQIEERLDTLKIRHTHVQLDSIKKYGASGHQ